MKLRKLEIGEFKNLRNFSVDFSQKLTTVLLGQNGCGKSNLLEALIIIFRDLDLGETPAFRYKLDYECRGHEIHIDADPARSKNKREQVQITVRERANGFGYLFRELRTIPYTQFYSDSERRYLPSYVFGYYSGPSNRMEKHFDKHQERFYRDLLDGKEQPLRPLLYARPVHRRPHIYSIRTNIRNMIGIYVLPPHIYSIRTNIRRDPLERVRLSARPSQKKQFKKVYASKIFTRASARHCLYQRHTLQKIERDL